MAQAIAATELKPARFAPANNYFDLVQLGMLAWRHRWLVAFTTLLGMAAGVLYWHQCQRLYRADAQVLVVKKRPDVLTGENRQASELDDYLASQRTILQSHLIVERAITQSKLNELSSFRNVDGDLAEAILKKLSVERLKDAPGSGNNILTISFVSPSADDCGAVVNAVLESYKSFLDETYRNISVDTIQIISQARSMLENDLAKKEAAYAKFRRESPMVWKGREEVNPHQERVLQLESQRSALMLRQAEVEGQMQSLESARKAGSSQEEMDRLVTTVANKEDIVPSGRSSAPSLKSQLAPLLHEEATLLEYLGPKHPQVLSVRERIEATRRLFVTGSAASATSAAGASKAPAKDLPALYLDHLRRERDHLRSSEQILAALSEREQKAARELNGYEVEDAGFRNGIARIQLLYDGVVKRLQEASLVKDYGGFEARVIDPAKAGKQVFPNALLVLTGATFLGMMLGGGLAGVAEIRRWRTRENERQTLRFAERANRPPDRYVARHSHVATDGTT